MYNPAADPLGTEHAMEEMDDNDINYETTAEEFATTDAQRLAIAQSLAGYDLGAAK